MYVNLSLILARYFRLVLVKPLPHRNRLITTLLLHDCTSILMRCRRPPFSCRDEDDAIDPASGDVENLQTVGNVG
jgi:hypothetical protein